MKRGAGRWLRVLLASLALATFLPLVAASPAEAQAVPVPQPDGQCGTAGPNLTLIIGQCADEAAWVLWNIKDPVFWQMAYVGAREIIAGVLNPKTDGLYGCSYPGHYDDYPTVLRDHYLDEYGPYQSCIVRVEREALEQAYIYSDTQERIELCQQTWLSNCQISDVYPDGELDEALGLYCVLWPGASACESLGGGELDGDVGEFVDAMSAVLGAPAYTSIVNVPFGPRYTSTVGLLALDVEAVRSSGADSSSNSMQLLGASHSTGNHYSLDAWEAGDGRICIVASLGGGDTACVNPLPDTVTLPVMFSYEYRGHSYSEARILDPTLGITVNSEKTTSHNRVRTLQEGFEGGLTLLQRVCEACALPSPTGDFESYLGDQAPPPSGIAFAHVWKLDNPTEGGVISWALLDGLFVDWPGTATDFPDGEAPEVPEPFPTPDTLPDALPAVPVPWPDPVEVPAPDEVPVPTTNPQEVPNAGEQGWFDALGNRIGGFFDNLASGIGGMFDALNNWLSSLLDHLLDFLRTWLKWMVDALGAILRSILDVLRLMYDLLKLIRDALVNIGQALAAGLTAVGNAIATMAQALGNLLGSVIDAIKDLPGQIFGLLKSFLLELFMPSGFGLEDVARSCETAFPCSWIQELVDAAGEFGGIVAGTDSCTAPSFDTGAGGVLSLPAPDGCAGGNGAQDGDAGDLFGYRVMLRAIFLVALIAGAMISVLQLTPWGFKSPIEPQQLTLFD